MRNLGSYKGFRALAGKRTAPADGTLVVIYRDGVKFQELYRIVGVPDDEAIYEFRYNVDKFLHIGYKTYPDLIDKNIPYKDLLPR